MSDTGTSQDYQVLARKYRPQTFDDLIGQDAMVRTLTNAFKSGRVAHAFMMTGVRGIGKTTTARLLARALNYQTDDVDAPQIDLSVPGIHCEAINQSRHVDVMEMDAASRTGVGDIREILEGVRYSPVSARYKVYIIDEVHMLSASAFNALLKTLEEPPDHAKFIFATTEIRKVPITVLSRCQRFDLRRVEADVLSAHLKNICQTEGMAVDDDGIALIARAAEGSVRDGLSLLDQAMVQRMGSDAVTGEQVREMLGLADRVRVLDLFELAVTGKSAEALLELKSQYDDGADPVVIMGDLLDICHEAARAAALKDKAEMDMAPDQVRRIVALAESLSMGQLTRYWQMLLKSHTDVRMAPVPLAAAEMALIRLGVASDMPPPERAAQMVSQAPAQTTRAAAPQSPPTAPSSGNTALKLAPPPQPEVSRTVELQSLDEVVAFVDGKRDIQLKLDIENYIRLKDFEPGRIEFDAPRHMPDDFPARLSRKLQGWTEMSWEILANKTDGGAQTLKEARLEAEEQARAELMRHPVIETALSTFAGAELVEVRDRGGQVVHVDFTRPDRKSS